MTSSTPLRPRPASGVPSLHFLTSAAVQGCFVAADAPWLVISEPESTLCGWAQPSRVHCWIKHTSDCSQSLPLFQSASLRTLPTSGLASSHYTRSPTLSPSPDNDSHASWSLSRVCVVYGALPPEMRRQQARLFNEPGNDYTLLVASDAVGMGLNLNIRRVVFHTLHKSEGTYRRPVPVSQIKQIAGGAYWEGERGGVSCQEAAVAASVVC